MGIFSNFSSFQQFLESFDEIDQVKGDTEVVKKYNAIKDQAGVEDLATLESSINRVVFDFDDMNSLSTEDLDRVIKGMAFVEQNVKIIHESETSLPMRIFERIFPKLEKEANEKILELKNGANKLQQSCTALKKIYEKGVHESSRFP